MMWCAIDILRLCLDRFYFVFYFLGLMYFLGSTDLFKSCHVSNDNYELYKVWIFENKIAIITCAQSSICVDMNVKIYYKHQ